MKRVVVLTVEVDHGTDKDFITGRPIVIDARPETVAHRLLRLRQQPQPQINEATRRCFRAGLAVGIRANIDAYALIMGASATRTISDPAIALELVPIQRLPTDGQETCV